EGRSGVAAKDQGYRPLSPKAGKADQFLCAESFEAEVGWIRAHLWPRCIPRCHGLQSYAECWGERVAVSGEHQAHRVPRSGGRGAGTHVLHQVAKMVAVRLTQTGHHVVALGFMHGCRPSGMSDCGVASYRNRRRVPCHLVHRHLGGRMEGPGRDVKAYTASWDRTAITHGQALTRCSPGNDGYFLPSS